MRIVASFSGGKDSTAMVLHALEEGMQIDEIVMFDTGWEFPQMMDHVAKVQECIGREITILKPTNSFEFSLIDREIKSKKDRTEKGIAKGDVYRRGNCWPSPMRRWCTREKVQTIDRYLGNETRLIGFAADESRRLGKNTIKAKKYDTRYPLIEWGMTEADCLKYCVDRGFDWGGLYKHFSRVSCFCCPLQRLGELRTLRRHFSELWAKMLGWEDRMGDNNKGFKDYTTVHDLDARFAREDLQMELAFDGRAGC